MLQSLAELLLMLRRQPAKLGIALQSSLLFIGRHILVTTQPVARVAGVSPDVWWLTRRRVLAVWLALRALISLPRHIAAVSLRRARSGKSQHGGHACRRQPLRKMSRSFQFPACSFLVPDLFIPASRESFPPASRVRRDFVLHRELIE